MLSVFLALPLTVNGLAMWRYLKNRLTGTAAKFINKSSLFILLTGLIRPLELRPNSEQKLSIYSSPRHIAKPNVICSLLHNHLRFGHLQSSIRDCLPGVAVHAPKLNSSTGLCKTTDSITFAKLNQRSSAWRGCACTKA